VGRSNHFGGIMILETLATNLIIGNYFILTGLFISSFLGFYFYLKLVNEIKEAKQKLQEQEKKIQNLQTSLANYDIIAALTNSSLYYTPTTPSSSSGKKSTTPKPSLSVLKNDADKNNDSN